MKSVQVNKNNVTEARYWCLENIGEENTRWWMVNGVPSYQSSIGSWVNDVIFMLDLTEEEETNLSYFLLRWA